MAAPDSQGPLSPDIWSLKPWWCQPWSILATGLAIVAGSWLLLPWRWISAVVLVAVALWWWVFLVLMPAQWRQWVKSPDRSSAMDQPDRTP